MGKPLVVEIGSAKKILTQLKRKDCRYVILINAEANNMVFVDVNERKKFLQL